MTTPSEILSKYTNQSQMSSYFLDKLKIFSIMSYAGDKTINDGITDATEALFYAINDVLLQGGGVIYFPQGKYVITNIAFYINSSNYHFSLKLIGAGRSTVLILKDYTDKSLFAVNENEDGTKYAAFPGPNRLCCENMTIDGGQSTSAKFAKYHQSGCYIKNIRFENMYYGVLNTGYSDHAYMDHVEWLSPKLTDGWCYKSMAGSDDTSGGDTGYFNHIFCYGTGIVNAVRLALCTNALISGVNGGKVEISASKDVTIQNSHIEFTADAPAISILDSIVNIRDNELWNNNRRPGANATTGYSPITINDVGDYGSIVTIENNTFQRKEGQYVTRPADIRLINLKSFSKVILRNNKTFIENGDSFNIAGIKIQADFDSTFNTELQRNMSVLHKEVVLKKRGGVWNTYNLNTDNIHPIIQLDKPTIVLAESTSYHNAMPEGDYYYKVVAYTLKNRHSIASDEAHITKTGLINNSCVTIQITTAESYLLIYRGTSTGVYDKVAIVPCTSDIIKVYDTGDYISGYEYIDPANLPFSAATPETTNSTGNGTINIITNTTITEKSALPTSDYVSVTDDVIKLTEQVTGGAYEYKCTVGSTPGTWRLTKQVGVKKDTTANRPTLSTSDVGYLYLDSTLDADGKPIWWTGIAWVDATGTTV